MWWKLPERALGSADLVQPLHFSGEGEETPERLLLAQGHRPFLLFLKKLGVRSPDSKSRFVIFTGP